jgi:hypothetical protein
MTEQERDEDLLAELLEHPDQARGARVYEEPILTRRDEQKLLQEANSADPSTLAPADVSYDLTTEALGPRRAGAASSFGAEALDIVRRHPVPALLTVWRLRFGR